MHVGVVELDVLVDVVGVVVEDDYFLFFVLRCDFGFFVVG